MSKDISLHRMVKKKKISRDIVKEVLSFGVDEEQKIDIIFNLSLTLENNDLMKEIASVLKNYQKTVNNEKDDNNVLTDNKKILLT